eukprot:GSChrysophyteH1.ASY1.ANO1.1616.1 assembled CDS
MIIEAIFWDVDGTLSNSFSLGFEATNDVLLEHGREPISVETYHAGTIYATPRRFAWHLTGDPDDESGIGDEFGKYFDENYISKVSIATAPLFEGVHDMLTAVKLASGGSVKFGALSNACGEYVRAVMKANKITNEMELQLGADDVSASKPSPAGLLEMCEKLRISPDKCAYVGDSPTDGQAAHSANFALAVGCTWGSHSAEAVQQAFDVVVNSVSELQAYLLALPLVGKQYDKEDRMP